MDILEVIEDATSPQDLDVTYTVQKTDNTVAVSFSLLNPGDQTQFGILLSGFTSEYTARARIVGIQKFKVIERVVEFREVKGKTPVTVYVVGFFVLFLLAGIIGGIIEIIEDYKIREAIASDTFDLPKGKPKEDYIEFLRYTFTHKIEKELRPLTSFIEGMALKCAAG